MTPYYDRAGKCGCGCGAALANGRRFVSGHNLKTLGKTELHKQHIADGLRRSWASGKAKRKFFPIGSKHTNHQGYVIVKVEHGKRWRLEHSLVMEKMIGRRLEKNELVHHINGARDDNRPENLFLCSGPDEHRAIETTLLSVFRELLNSGVAKFNAKERRYEAVL